MAQRLYAKPPRLNERVFIGHYQSYQHEALFAAAETILKCGLVAEVEKRPGTVPSLYAARRRGRRK